MTPRRTAGPCGYCGETKHHAPDCMQNGTDAQLQACNAHDSLIAQRDALAEALRYIVEWNDTTWNAETARDKARAALAAIDSK